MSTLQTCRLCGLSNYEDRRPMVKYSVRHSAHWECKLKPLSDEERKAFLRSLPLHRVMSAPWMLLDDFGLLAFVDELKVEKAEAR
jgi:hypothetical protein